MTHATLDSALASGLLDKTKHAALLRESANVTRAANIPLTMLYTSMVGLCSEQEIDYVRALRRQADVGVYGMVVCGNHSPTPILDRFAAIAGACLRNYISARVMTVQEALDALDADGKITASVLLIPNFGINAKNGGRMAEWEVPALLGMMYSRQSAACQTVVYVESLKALALSHGTACAEYLGSEHFVKADANFNK